jgi:hypothetical protein
MELPNQFNNLWNCPAVACEVIGQIATATLRRSTRSVPDLASMPQRQFSRRVRRRASFECCYDRFLNLPMTIGHAMLKKPKMGERRGRNGCAHLGCNSLAKNLA